jgi:hypothetical protein
MRLGIASLLMASLMVVGCSISQLKKKLDSEELNHYRALRVYMDDPDSTGRRKKTDRKEFLSLKTRAERDKWLKDKSLWDRFYKYDAHIREKIVDGSVQVGWDRQMVYMSWGHPFTRKKLPGRKASRSELLTYRFEQMRDGTIQLWVPGSKTEYKAARLFVQELFVDDDKVTEIQQKDAAW